MHTARTLLLAAAAIFAGIAALQSTRTLAEVQLLAAHVRAQALPPGCVIAYKPGAIAAQPVLLPVRVCDPRHKET